MKILHVTGYFMSDMAYQENLLPRGQAELGHEVIIITGCVMPNFGFNAESRRVKPSVFECEGVLVERLPDYFELENKGVVLKGLFRQIRSHRPDLLFIHGPGQALVIGLLYKIIFPSVVLQMDTHSTLQNSGNSKFGNLYHFLFRILFTLFKSRFLNIFAISPETVFFMKKYYGLSESDITLLPLPGDASLLKDYKNNRDSFRKKYNFLDGEKVVVHTGKMPGDKETLALLEAFRNLKGSQYRLILIGSISPEFSKVLDRRLISDPRVEYKGWLCAEELREIFVAADLLVQPGSLSNTFIDAICCGLPIVLDDTPQGRFLTDFDNGFVVERGDTDKLSSTIDYALELDKHKNLRVAAIAAAVRFDFKSNAKESLEALNE